MTRSTKIKLVIAGVLMANSAPHLATAASGHRHLTPLAGRESSPAVNLVWAAANLVGSAALLRTVVTPAADSGRWDSGLIAFEAGYFGWAAWMAVSEYVLKINWDQG
jgi:hypothetical protein